MATNTLVLRRSAAIVVLVIQFVMVVGVFTVYSDVLALRRFDSRRAYDICLGSNQQIARVVEKLTMPSPIPPTATEAERLVLTARNERVQQSQGEIQGALQQNRAECLTLLQPQPRR